VDALLGVALLMLGACDHVFYLPQPQLTLVPQQIGIACDEQFVAVDGDERLHVWHLRPRGTPRDAVVVHFHGNFANMSAHVGGTAWLVEQGYRVVMFDYRGYGRSSGRVSRANTVADGRALLRAVVADPRYRGAPLFVFGQSLGGAVALPSLVAERAALGERLRGVVVEGSFDRYRAVARAKVEQYPLGGLLSGPLGWLLISSGHEPADAARQLDVPALFVHATGDPIVPFVAGERLAAASAAPDTRTLWVDARDHLAAFGTDDALRQELLRWLQRHAR
jgi:alpha-beta hydrolase superfamily lysophospholipase